MAEIPQSIGRYNVLEVLGKGAMGVVYKAIDPVIDRVVAIKTIRLTLSDEELAFYEARFAQEIKTVGKLNHRHIVTIYDVGRTEQYAYMAMEFIEGPELKMLMTAGKPMHAPTAIELIAQTAEGLAFAHAREIVHRDVKPSNIMVVMDEDGMVAKVTDFGIARGATSAVKTMTGMILGSPRYMSPEQVNGRTVGPRSDVFSLGVVLYEMLAGVPPFDADSVSSIMYQTVHMPHESLAARNQVVPPELDAIVGKALAKDPEQRYATMKEFSRALREIARGMEAPLQSLPLAPSPLDTGPHMRVASATRPPAPAGAEGHMLSLDFDSLAGSKKLAELTNASPDVTSVLMAKAPPEPAKPAAPSTPPAARASAPAPAPAPAAVAPTQPFPVLPAALLGSLAVIALALGLALLR